MKFFNLKTGWQFIKDLFGKIGQHDVLTQSAALAFYTAFSLAPLLILLVSSLSTLNLNLQEEFLFQVQGLVGSQAAEILQVIINGAKDRSDLNHFASIAGFITLLLSASAIFAQLQSSLNIIFNSPPKNPNLSWLQLIYHYVLHRLVSFGVVLTFVFISITSLVVSTTLSIWLNDDQIFGQFLNTFISLIVFSLLFAAIFKWMPDRKIEKRSAFQGGLITSILFVIGKGLIGLYLGRAAVGSAYGAAGSFIVLLVWVYYSSLIVFLGAEISALLLDQSKGKNVST